MSLREENVQYGGGFEPGLGIRLSMAIAQASSQQDIGVSKKESKKDESHFLELLKQQKESNYILKTGVLQALKNKDEGWPSLTWALGIEY